MSSDLKKTLDLCLYKIYASAEIFYNYLPLFIHVIDNCSVVAVATHIR